MKIENIIKTNAMTDHSKTVVNLMYTASVIGDRISDVLKPFDVTSPQFNVLRILRGQKGKPANLSTIQERMIHKMSNTTRLVDKLIAKDYVNRCTCEQNRRKIEIYITNEGLKALAKMSEAVHKAEKEIIKDLSPKDLEEFNMLLEKLRN
ncbi:MarR family transcriptional regulator [Galbibacter sp. EGI 63066]|uniref:MarR family winged helix-turn-helix transcriptional regulator n=1 Tax=Galbibacter sp. EGI 63066 TaxID=2993559 RepID=UPI002248D777|nr:MarR family transcriptional regulator [Galbibacter sp. EGI 63066]MCX2679700.1 MarR family transcriptional regulator [Galbibacter sp. EGI 63066]